MVVVVPFADHEVPTLFANLDLWSSTPACQLGQPAADMLLVGSVYQDDLQSATRAMQGHESFLKCFRKVTYALSDVSLHDDFYPVAPNSVFFWMMFESGLVQDGYKYILQHELDVHPIANEWLNTLLSTAETYVNDPSVRPWVIGAGKVEQDAHTGKTMHVMNGNAIYVNDPDFISFLERYQQNFSYTEDAFDTRMGHYLVEENLDPAKHFMITPRIVNCNGQNLLYCSVRGPVPRETDPWLPISPETALVHVKGVDKKNWDFFKVLGAYSNVRAAGFI